MEESKSFDNYPLRYVIVSNLLSLSIYAIGAFIIYQIGLVWLIVYLLLILSFEARLLGGHCVDCYYYGKTCAFGKGRLSCIFFEQGKSEDFARRKITWKDILPDFLVFIVPLTVGIAILLQSFTWSLVLLLLALAFLSFFGNAIVRGHLACKYCQQRVIGCPAEQLFQKTKK